MLQREVFLESPHQTQISLPEVRTHDKNGQIWLVSYRIQYNVVSIPNQVCQANHWYEHTVHRATVVQGEGCQGGEAGEVMNDLTTESSCRYDEHLWLVQCEHGGKEWFEGSKASFLDLVGTYH